MKRHEASSAQTKPLQGLRRELVKFAFSGCTHEPHLPSSAFLTAAVLRERKQKTKKSLLFSEKAIAFLLDDLE